MIHVMKSCISDERGTPGLQGQENNENGKDSLPFGARHRLDLGPVALVGSFFARNTLADL